MRHAQISRIASPLAIVFFLSILSLIYRWTGNVPRIFNAAGHIVQAERDAHIYKTGEKVKLSRLNQVGVWYSTPRPGKKYDSSLIATYQGEAKFWP